MLGPTILTIYGTMLLALSVFSVHRSWLAWSGRKLSEPNHPPPKRWPSVLVQIPLYNERYVATRAIKAVAKLAYEGKLTIQVLDDSTDDTASIVGPVVKELAADGIDIVHIRRSHRKGFKAGALAEGMNHDDAEFIAIFDADFVPQSDFLSRLMPSFCHGQIGMVQAAWGHLNRDDNALTHGQAILLDGHFFNEHSGRHANNCFFNFNGTAGIWRRQAIIDGGGWLSRTITEDLDLSYRAQLAGWQFVYRPDVVVEAELPSDAQAFKTQQHRWAKGSIETAQYLLKEIWRSPNIGLGRRIEATFHLLGNLAYPLVILVALLLPATLFFRPVGVWWVWALDAALLLGSTGSLIGFYGVAAARSGAGRVAFRHVPVAMALGAGLAINNTRGLVEALRGRRSEFIRTPKSGGAHQRDVRRQYLPSGVGLSGQSLLEMLLGSHLVATMFFALSLGHYFALPFLGLFAAGFLILGAGSLRQTHVAQRKESTDKPVTSAA